MERSNRFRATFWATSTMSDESMKSEKIRQIDAILTSGFMERQASGVWKDSAALVVLQKKNANYVALILKLREIKRKTTTHLETLQGVIDGNEFEKNYVKSKERRRRRRIWKLFKVSLMVMNSKKNYVKSKERRRRRRRRIWKLFKVSLMVMNSKIVTWNQKKEDEDDAFWSFLRYHWLSLKKITWN